MKKQPFCNFLLAGVSLTHYGMKIPSPFVKLVLENSQIDSMTQWTLSCVVGGDSSKSINIAAFEALIYSAAQSSSNSGEGTAGIPVSFIFGWLNEYGNIESHLSYQGFSLNYSASTSGQYMEYTLTGYASLSLQTHLPVLNIPEIRGVVQPSAIVEAVAKAVKADTYYDLDIDHNDSPTYVSHGALATSFNSYIGGSYTGEDDYNSFPGLVTLSKSYNTTRSASGYDYRRVNKLSCLLNNLSVTPVSNYLVASNTDTTPQISTFSYWVDEPTMTSKGVIHYKSNASLLSTASYGNILKYGTSDANVLAIQGSYDGIAYNMTDMSFASLGFSVDGSGNTVADSTQVVNSWASSLANVYQSANIINDINALASQFSGKFTITIPGSTKQYQVVQPISLIVMSGNTLSPISGIYSIVNVSHQITSRYLTILEVQRLVMSSANQVAASQGIIIHGSASYPASAYSTTSNIISTGKVELGTLYPTFEDILTM